jgi:hypothetical protein
MTRISDTNRRPLGDARSSASSPGSGTHENGSGNLNPLGAVFAGRPGAAIAVHNNIEFSVKEREAGVWRWEYAIGSLINQASSLCRLA